MGSSPLRMRRVEGGHWRLSFAAEDPAVTIPGKDADAATERVAEDLRPLSAEQLAERTLGGDRGVEKPLMTSDGHGYNLQSVHQRGSKRRVVGAKMATACRPAPKGFPEPAKSV